MPLPKTTNVGTVMRELKQGRKRSYKQRIAIALSHVRKMGANIPQKNTRCAFRRAVVRGK